MSRRSLAIIVVLGLAIGGCAADVTSPTSREATAQAPSGDGGTRLVYQLAGDIYLGHADGTDATLVADGTPGVSYSLSPGSVWSPDGAYFLYHSDGEIHVRDADGRMVSSFPAQFGYWDRPAWSPDSTRIQGWTRDGAEIAIYNINGDLEASLLPPDGYGRLWDVGAYWAPDGRSLFAAVQRPGDVGEVWELPVDGLAPHQVPPDHALASQSVTFARDGRQVAYLRDAGTEMQLFIANADGSGGKMVGEAGSRPAFPSWSPGGDRLGYAVSNGNVIDLAVLDLASGNIQTAVAGFSRDGYPPFSWSPTGNQILFAAPNPAGMTSLWSANADGTGRAVLIEGAAWGELQPVAPAS